MTFSLPHLQMAEIDSVPVLWTPLSSSGLMCASLIFRVGRADEMLEISGITHLVEHLALSAFEGAPYTYDGTVDGTHTSFAMKGTPLEVEDFVVRLTTALTHLPIDRIEQELAVLSVESADGVPHAFNTLRSIRYGPAGHGLAAWPEVGLPDVDGSVVANWARRFFTADNAVLCISGPMPEALRLFLPRGERYSAPGPVSVVTLPAYQQVGSNFRNVALGVEAPFSYGLRIATSIMERHLRQRLRHSRGLSYQVEAQHDRLTLDRVHVAVMADGLPTNLASICDELLLSINRMVEQRPDHKDLTDVVDAIERHYADPSNARDWLDDRGVTLLLGDEILNPTDLVTCLREVTPDDVSEALAHALTKAVLMIPDHVPAPPGFYPVEDSEGRLPEGHSYHARGLQRWRGTRLLVGPDGFAIRQRDRTITSLSYASCVGVGALRNGDLGFVSRSGDCVRLRSGAWARWARILRDIDLATTDIPRIQADSLFDNIGLGEASPNSSPRFSA